MVYMFPVSFRELLMFIDLSCFIAVIVNDILTSQLHMAYFFDQMDYANYFFVNL